MEPEVTPGPTPNGGARSRLLYRGTDPAEVVEETESGRAVFRTHFAEPTDGPDPDDLLAESVKGAG